MADDTGTASVRTDTVVAAARATEPDRYLAALLAPPSAREGLLALAAFSAELARIPFAASSEPAIGEIRLQWWRDALGTSMSDTRTGSPVADALRAAIQRHELPAAPLLDMIDARSFDLSGEITADEAAFWSYLWKSEGVPFALAARILSPGMATEAESAARACGEAYGLARMLFNLAPALSHGRLQLPQDWLDAAGVTRNAMLAGEGSERVAALLAGFRSEARRRLVSGRQHVSKLPRRLRAAFLPLALVEPYLRALEKPGRDPLRGSADILPLTRVCRIVMAHWLGRM